MLIAPVASVPEPGSGAGRPVATTEGTLLGGRVRYRQFRDGYRTGIEPVLLAASIPARPLSRVVEAGCGAGAGLLCLSARLPDAHGTGIERDPATAGLARENLDRAGRADWPVLACALDLAAAAAGPPGFDHAIANPPWHRANATASPEPRRDLARRAPAGLLAAWCGALARLLRDGGGVTLVLPASQHADASEALRGAGFGAVRLLPLWPLPGRPARIVLVRATRGARGDGAILPGLVLHRPEGGFSEAAERLLRDGEPLLVE